MVQARTNAAGVPAAGRRGRPSPAARSVMSLLRLPVSFLIATVLTAGMFWALNQLIGTKVEVGERQKALKIDFSRLRRDSEIKMIKRQKPEPVKQAEPLPDAPKITAAETVQAPSAGPIAIGPGAGLNVDVKGILGGPGAMGAGGIAGGGGGADRAEMPLVRIQPEYPPRALSRGIEGWVVVGFTIASTGTTKDVKAVEADPPGVFEQAAVRAVESWKYNPKIQGGTPVERPGMRVMLTFKISR